MAHPEDAGATEENARDDARWALTVAAVGVAIFVAALLGVF